ncbi:MAG TPA: thiamine pyrophosphate-binding protein [Acidimicrobiales bacterium]|jgi:pyruvate dehydrogenase (quinone)/pyruvate oxidase|nr:thiamine pyrophosphate-binding protein [Acidimicrobiales bacterium]
MGKIASELLIERLVEWGVDTVFGLPGDGINGITEALRRHQDKIRFVLVHHEEAAAFMACGYAKVTGKVGVCLATSGPGGVHLLNGLYDAKLDHQPVLAITGMQETQLLGTGYQQEVHLEKLFQDVAGYEAMVHVPVQIPTLVDLAIRHAIAHRTVTHITFPNDLQVADADANPWQAVAPARTPATAPVYIAAPGVPRGADLGKAAEVLNAGQRVVLLAGAGALGAREELLAVAEQLASPIVKTLPGKGCVPDDHPLTTGGIGLLGTKPSEDAMEQADTLFMVGTNFPYTKHLPSPGQVRVVQIDVDAAAVGNRIPTEVPLVGDSAASLQALLPLLSRKADRAFLETAQASMVDWREKMAALEDPDRDPIQPQYLMRVIDRHAADDAILASDSGTIATWSARHFDIRGRREYYLSGNLATMAPGLPYTIAAQWAHPGRQCIAFVGDGGYAMLMAETITAIRHDLPVKVFINNNAEYGQILWEQMVLGYPEFGVRHRGVADYAAFAQANGALGLRVDKAADLEAAVVQALAHPGPAVVDVLTNPDEPPMPAKVSYKQAKGFATAFLKGQPHKATIATTLFHDKIAELRD